MRPLPTLVCLVAGTAAIPALKSSHPGNTISNSKSKLSDDSITSLHLTSGSDKKAVLSPESSLYQAIEFYQASGLYQGVSIYKALKLYQANHFHQIHEAYKFLQIIDIYKVTNVHKTINIYKAIIHHPIIHPNQTIHLFQALDTHIHKLHQATHLPFPTTINNHQTFEHHAFPNLNSTNVSKVHAIDNSHGFDYIFTATTLVHASQPLTIARGIHNNTLFGQQRSRPHSVGDTVKIHVTNRLTDNGTTMHWHGVRQNGTVQADGVPSIIQCPDALEPQPGTTHTYTWRATQYGTSWYHSHYALQAWTGVFGAIVIHGPATANYDVDVGPVMVTDWSHSTVDALWTSAQTKGPPTLDTALINGMGTFNGTGERFEMVFEAGKKHRLRFVNSAIDTAFKLSLDGHTMTVIAMDFVPVVPFEIDVLDIIMGQRYDVVIAADQTATDYWFRAIPQASCSRNDNTNDIRAVVRYSNSSVADPTTTAWNQTDACVDVSYSSLVPHVSHTVVSPTLQNTTLGVSVGKDSSSLFKRTIGLDSMKVIWNNPSLLQIAEGNATWETAENAYLLPEANK
ncbi:hypothetical protein EKO04_000441 [Ascochyta lentis]|uniref:Laccase n=1 Tax=Ascochyta lentis TaxID=205686 RepID=A0A8H7MM52_9PLEO|nr:hypothetical protein EKO04_000441 [Ascochyta lentis]